MASLAIRSEGDVLAHLQVAPMRLAGVTGVKFLPSVPGVLRAQQPHSKQGSLFDPISEDCDQRISQSA